MEKLDDLERYIYIYIYIYRRVALDIPTPSYGSLEKPPLVKKIVYPQ